MTIPKVKFCWCKYCYNYPTVWHWDAMLCSMKNIYTVKYSKAPARLLWQPWHGGLCSLYISPDLLWYQHHWDMWETCFCSWITADPSRSLTLISHKPADVWNVKCEEFKKFTFGHCEGDISGTRWALFKPGEMFTYFFKRNVTINM